MRNVLDRRVKDICEGNCILTSVRQKRWMALDFASKFTHHLFTSYSPYFWCLGIASEPRLFISRSPSTRRLEITSEPCTSYPSRYYITSASKNRKMPLKKKVDEKKILLGRPSNNLKVSFYIVSHVDHHFTLIIIPIDWHCRSTQRRQVELFQLRIKHSNRQCTKLCIRHHVSPDRPLHLELATAIVMTLVIPRDVHLLGTDRSAEFLSWPPISEGNTPMLTFTQATPKKLVSPSLTLASNGSAKSTNQNPVSPPS